MSPTRRRFVTAGSTVLAAIAGCATSDSGSTTSPTGNGSSTTTSNGDASPSPSDGESTTTTKSGVLPPLADRTFPLPDDPTTLEQAVISGGVPKDGIPPIDAPTFEPADQVGDRLTDADIVFGLERDGQAKAYPRQILVWHEVCNDTIAGDPVAVTYCPLTGTILAFDRGETSFGVSGRLLNDNLIMYDRGTEHWWPQVLATSIPSEWTDGEYTTKTLRDSRVIWTTWGRWRSLHPDTAVLTRETGYLRNYDEDPYGAYQPARRQYYVPNSEPLFPPLGYDPKYVPKRVVLGARTPNGAVAFLKDALRDNHRIDGMLGVTPVMAIYDQRLDTGYIYRNPDNRSFTVEGDVVVDDTGTEYPPDALPLDRVHTIDAMWFAWSGFYPDTRVYE